MKKYFFIAFALLPPYFSSAQNDSVYAKVEITSVSMNEHRQWIDTSIVIIIEKYGSTTTINIGKIDSIEIGIQFELFKSELGEKNKILLGIALFTNENGKWKMYQNPIYQSSEYKTITGRSEMSEQDFSHAGTGIQDLQIEYKTQIYIIKK